MSNRLRKVSIFVLGMFVLTLISCRSLSLQSEEVVRGKIEYYLINPDTILADIAQGKSDIFVPLNITPEPPLSNSLSVVQWSQMDYLDIIGALYGFVWNESMEDWHIRYMSFSLKCEDVSNGPQFAYFVLYKLDQVQDQETRFERQIYIDPSNNSVSWVELEYYPNLVRIYPVDLTEYKVSVVDALQIAEKNGGEEIRTQVKNNCKVSAQSFNSNNDWRVSYVKVLDLLNLDIDALTGEHKIIDTETR